MTTEIDTLATALYAVTDDLLKESPQFAPLRPAVGLSPQLSDAELVTLAVTQALLGFTSGARWIRHARARLRHLFPYLPQQSGYNKRLRAARGLIRHCARALPESTSLWTDDVWVVDSTPVECARSRETVKRSELAGWAQDGYCASHSRWFWGLRLHLLTTLQGLPVGFALTGAKADERQILPGILADGSLPASPGQVIIGDKNYYGRDFEDKLAAAGLALLRPARKGEPEPAGRQYFKPLRQVIESVNDTLKGQLDLERHGGRTIDGVTVRILQRILALTAAIWHNNATGQPVMRSLVAYDHGLKTPSSGYSPPGSFPSGSTRATGRPAHDRSVQPEGGRTCEPSPKPSPPQTRTDRVVSAASYILNVIYLGLFPTTLGFAAWAYALARTTSGKMGATTYAIPALAVIMSWLVLGQVPRWLTIAGGILCLAGVAISRTPATMRKRAQPAVLAAASEDRSP